MESEIIDERRKENAVYMCGYLPGVSPDKSPILSPAPSPISGSETWKDVCGGGCGFAIGISDAILRQNYTKDYKALVIIDVDVELGSGKLITWGSAEDEGQSYLTSGRHGETPEAYPLPTEASVVNASAGWAHCVAVAETGEVFTWGWKECVPSGKFGRELTVNGSFQKDNTKKQDIPQPEQVCQSDKKKVGEEMVKRRKVSAAKEEFENSSSCGDEFFIPSPSLVNLGPGVRITTVTSGGRHTLALSDVGQVWGWGYGGEGQLGLGTRIKTVTTPHLIPCMEQSAGGKDRSLVVHQGSMNTSALSKLPGTYVKKIACGGRHSAVVTDAGVLLTFGWGLYGQCGQGSTNDQLRPTCVPSLAGTQVEGIAAGLWHTICITVDGRVYAFGGNQFGQLGTGAPQAETQPRLLDSPGLQNDGQFYSWGWNKYGQLGLGDTIDRNMPSHVPIHDYKPKNLACGWWHTLLLAETPC